MTIEEIIKGIALIKKNPKAKILYKLDDDVSFTQPDDLIIHKVYVDKYTEYDGEILLYSRDYDNEMGLCMAEKGLYLNYITGEQAREWEIECSEMHDWNDCIIVDRGV